VAGWSGPAWAEGARRWRIGVANPTLDPAERLEGLGFSGAEVRASWVYAARGLPVELVFFDNDRNREKALANAAEAVRQGLDLYAQYCADEAANAEIGELMRRAGIPVLAVNHAVPGAPPLHRRRPARRTHRRRGAGQIRPRGVARPARCRGHPRRYPQPGGRGIRARRGRRRRARRETAAGAADAA
jgi:hypothetical protein